MRHRRLGGEAYARQVAPVHAMLRAELAALPVLVARVPDGGAVAAERVGTWAWEVLDGLHHYRRAQCDLMFPALDRGLRPGDAGAGEVEAARPVLDALDLPVQRAQGAALRWQDGGRRDDRAACEAALRELWSVLETALHHVERRLAPVVDTTLTRGERTRLAHALWLGARGRRRRELLAAVLEHAPAPAAVLREAPWHVRRTASWSVVAPHARRMALLRSG